MSLENSFRKFVNVTRGKINGTQAMCHCPCHHDRNPSLSLTLKKQRLLFYCHVGCTQSEIVRFCRNNNIQIKENA